MTRVPLLCVRCGGERPPEARSYCADCAREVRLGNVAENNRELRARQAHVAGRDAHTPTQRLLAVLRVLRRHKGTAVATSQLHQLDAYGDDEAGRKRLQRDLRVLEAHGLVQRCLTESHLKNSNEGVQLVEVDKPERFHLTAGQHAAVAAARRALRAGAVAQALPDGPPSTAADRLDLPLRLIRVVEEHGDEITLTELTGLLGVARRDALRALRDLEDLRESRITFGINVVFDDEDHDELAEQRGDDIAGVMIIRDSDATPDRPLRDTGLDLLGRFGYTLPECDDRLALIQQALDDWAPQHAPEHVQPLKTAQRKLSGWRGLLYGITPARADEAV